MKSTWKVGTRSGIGLMVMTLVCGGGVSIEAMAGEGRGVPKPKRVEIPRLEGMLRFDGILDEAVWKKAAVLRPFMLNETGGKERERTEVRVWYDGKALYMGWEIQDRDIQATFTARDSRFWEEEVAEFFVTPGDLGRYFEFQWNPLGGVFDAVIVNQLDADGLSKGIRGEWGYTAKWMAKGVRVDGTVGDGTDEDVGWAVEVRIPFSDMGVKAPGPGDEWRGNFYRFNRGAGGAEELLSWSPTRRPGFHEPSRFGYFVFGK